MSSEATVKVWDPVVRVFHWSLALFFIISYLSSDLEDSPIHPLSGYAIVVLLMIRLVWGIVGTKHARFSDFIYSRAEISAYAKSLISGKAKRYLGHNPLGGLMIFLLFASLTMTTLTGMLYYGAEEGKGPLAGAIAQQSIQMPALISTAHADDDDHEHGDEKYEWLEEVHEFFGNFTLFLVLIHLAGVFVESVLHKESLVRAMWNGRKRSEI